MDHRCQQVLAGAGFTRDQHGDVRWCDAGRELAERAKRTAFSDDAVYRGREWRFGRHSTKVTAEQGFQLAIVGPLRDKVIRARSKRRDRRALRGVRAMDQDPGIWEYVSHLYQAGRRQFECLNHHPDAVVVVRPLRRQSVESAEVNFQLIGQSLESLAARTVPIDQSELQRAGEHAPLLQFYIVVSMNYIVHCGSNRRQSEKGPGVRSSPPR